MTLSQFLLLQAINAFFFPFFFAFLEFVRPVISFSVFFLVIVISFIMASIVRCQEQQNNKMQFSFHFFPSSNCWNKEDGTLLLSLGLSKRFHNFNDLKFFLDYGREKWERKACKFHASSGVLASFQKTSKSEGVIQKLCQHFSLEFL